jgi:hypothetical protein
MRGWFSLLTKRNDLGTYRTGLFIGSAEPDVIAKILPLIREHFPNVSFTYLMSRAYAENFSWIGQTPKGADVLWIESLKASPMRSLIYLRKRRFDVCIVMWQGRPTFLMTKAAAFWLNTQKLVIYNENGNAVPIDRTHWRYVLAHARLRLRKFPSVSLFYPFGFSYLLGRTLCLYIRSQFLRPHPNRSERPGCEF